MDRHFGVRAVRNDQKKLQSDLALYTLMQTLSRTLFERMSFYQLLTEPEYRSEPDGFPNQSSLFDKTLGH